MTQNARRRRWSLVTMLACAASLCLAAQTRIPPANRPASKGPPLTTAGWTPPRTPWGDADLSGTYTTNNESFTPLERPKELADRGITDPADLAALTEEHRQFANPKTKAQLEERLQFAINPGTGAYGSEWYDGLNAKHSRLWFVVDPPDGRIPTLTPEAQKRVQAERDARRGAKEVRLYDVVRPGHWLEDLHLWARCIARPLPEMGMPTGYNNTIQITQGPGYVAIQYEMIHDTRIVPLNGGPHLDPSIRQYLGDSRGHWEGNTLVVDVTNFRDNNDYRGSRENLHLIERYTRTSPDQIEYRMTVDDPTTFTKPWTISIPWTKDMSSAGLLEYACHEGNYAVPGMLRAARAEEKKAAEKKAPAVESRQQK
jgi:hypothetical protein